MIEEIQLTNFKCFQNSESFAFAKINLLTGINGRGKSSLLQSMLILSQSARKNERLERLVINDILVQLGNYDDIKNSDTPRSENISFDIKLKTVYSDRIKIEFSENSQEPLWANYVSSEFYQDNKELKFEDKIKEENLQAFSEALKKIHFVSADRLGPVKYVDKVNLPDFIHVGSRGEHTINILANSINFDNVHDSLYLGNDAKSLIQQTIEWMSYILDGAKIDIKGREKESSVLYMLLNNKSNSYTYKPTNVGFGYSYILPLIVTGLLAKPDEIIIVENPEAHLHPRAQSRISEFFAKVASCGVQVFIESHSEHILNGLRVSTLNPNIDIGFEDFAIHYFNESFDHTKFQMDSKGKIHNWPNGFFDQQELDLAEIFKYSHSI
ncbi:DUF3696 domain-containing protein [Myroides odoratimimus]|uniref:DUF3696 domain-containing protein n=1 Tax=Myroides odoratimimus TaxID=76832 RepID=UPI0025773DB5|nr:DUF3696 domain-containing protein [Myroides odoratimimus]MDM1506454.1 DUF3696 domain-containing protein [Myroides odoratimimus]